MLSAETMLRSKRSNATDTHLPYARRIPFYMYEPELFLAYTHCDATRVESPKHDHVILALEQFANHPWRTTAAEAEVFFIPVLIDYVTRGLCRKAHPRAKEFEDIPNTKYIQNMDSVIQQSGHYPQKRHFVIANDFQSFGFTRELRRVFPEMIVATMENGPAAKRWATLFSQCSFGIGYTTNYAIFVCHLYAAAVFRVLPHTFFFTGPSNSRCVLPCEMS